MHSSASWLPTLCESGLVALSTVRDERRSTRKRPWLNFGVDHRESDGLLFHAEFYQIAQT
jgi:hypothetical protein